MKKRIFNRKGYFEKYFHGEESLEKDLKGIPIRAEITSQKVIQEYLPVLELEYYIDVWDCTPRLAQRIHKESALQTKIIELKNEEAKSLFNKLIEEREVIINRSGHYYIETKEQRRILNKLLKNEGLR